jgi:hypothetical protein
MSKVPQVTIFNDPGEDITDANPNIFLDGEENPISGQRHPVRENRHSSHPHERQVSPAKVAKEVA